MSTPGDQDEGVTPAQSESVPSSIQPSLNLTVAGDIVSTYSEGRKHSEVFLKGQDGYVHYFYVENNTWLHDDQSFKVAGRVDSLAAVYERGGRSSSALFVKGEDGFLHYFYVLNGTWAHDAASFRAAGRISAAISAVYEKQRESSAVFVKGEDGFLHYFYVLGGVWQHDGTSFGAAGKISENISAVFEPQRNNTSVFVRGADGFLHFFYVDQSIWRHDNASFNAAGKISGGVSSIFEPERGHASVFVRGSDGLLHFFYVDQRIWRHDGASFNAAGKISEDTRAISSAYDPRESHCSVFTKSVDGSLHYFYVLKGLWQHDSTIFNAAGRALGAVSAIYEVNIVLKSYHVSVFVQGADGFLHYFFTKWTGYPGAFVWQHDGKSFRQGA
jgi:hypothetical protein